MKVIDMAVHEVATITADKTICDCARQMRLEHVGSLVVVNDDQTPLGMITDRDIAIEVVARNLDPMKLDRPRRHDDSRRHCGPQRKHGRGTCPHAWIRRPPPAHR